MPDPIAIFSALDVELSSLVTAASDTTRELAPFGSVWTGSLDGEDVVMARVGIGKVNAAAVFAYVVSKHNPRSAVFSGVAGGLNPGLDVGDIVIAEQVIQHDTGVLEADGLNRYQAGHVPFFNPTDEHGHRPSPDLLDRVRERMRSFVPAEVLGHEPRIVFGTILSGDQFLNDATTRQMMFEELGGDAIEMEGGAIAQLGVQIGLDHVVVRSLSDLAGENSATDFNRFVDEASRNSAAVVRHLLPEL